MNRTYRLKLNYSTANELFPLSTVTGIDLTQLLGGEKINKTAQNRRPTTLEAVNGE